jgi:chemotaxis protein MotB
MTVEGYGEHQPVADNDTAAGREQNRRVVLAFSRYAPAKSTLERKAIEEAKKDILENNSAPVEAETEATVNLVRSADGTLTIRRTSPSDDNATEQ